MTRRALPFACIVLIGAGAACSAEPPSDVAGILDALPEAAPETTESLSTTTTSPSQRTCEEDELATKSLRPGPMSEGGTLAEIRERARLRVAVDENTLGFAARNTSTGEIEGFEVELAAEIAARIFGDDADRVELVPVVTSEKIDVVEKGRADMSISANSMTCARWEDVAFSSEYYTAYQQFLVRADSHIQSVADLDGARVCVTRRSTSIALLTVHAPKADVQEEPDRTGCLLALREGQVDAYFGHDSFLLGMTKQDPTVKILPLLPPEDTVSHYGIAISHEHHDLVRFVNAALDEMRDDGTWKALHREYLEKQLDIEPTDPPQAEYRD